MEPFKTLDSIIVPLDRANVDTDAIIPKQFMKSIQRTGFGDNLFDEWRYLDHGEPGQDVRTRQKNPEFPLNQPRYAGARILLTRDNFGCGSSREHAPWALRDYGIRAIIAPSFAEIFQGNCFKNGILPVRLAPAVVDALFAHEARTPGLRAHIDLARQQLDVGAEVFNFDVEPDRKHRLLEGLDDIGLTLQRTPAIRAYEDVRRRQEPWLFEAA